VTKTFSSLPRPSHIEVDIVFLLLLTGAHSSTAQQEEQPAVPFTRFTNAQHLFSLGSGLLTQWKIGGPAAARCA
jgi:hypothetical protein